MTVCGPTTLGVYNGVGLLLLKEEGFSSTPGISLESLRVVGEPDTWVFCGGCNTILTTGSWW